MYHPILQSGYNQMKQFKELMTRKNAKSIEDARCKQYEFWDTQPVPKFCKFDYLYIGNPLYCG